MIPQVIDRLKARVDRLEGRVDGAASLAALMERNALPRVTPAAFVLPLGARGLAATASTGAYVQGVESVLGVLLMLRGNDRTGERALGDVGAFLRAIPSALVGWRPEGTVGVLSFSRSFLASSRGGALSYQFEFILSDQLRINPT